MKTTNLKTLPATSPFVLPLPIRTKSRTNHRAHHRRLSSGDTALPMPAGVYFVRLPGGTVSKVSVER